MVNSMWPSPTEVEEAHHRFLENEPRDLFYRAATELTELVLKGQTCLTLSEAIAVLLQTWNRAYYQYFRFNQRHFAEIDRLLTEYKDIIISRFRSFSSYSFSYDDKRDVEVIFAAFENVLGPTGASKALHLLAPRFFPLWDGAIAKAYGCAFKPRGRNAAGYRRFMEIAHSQCSHLQTSLPDNANLLKLLDEYNYCKYTKRWL